MIYTTQHIAKILGLSSQATTPIKHLLFDSRQLVFPKSTLFFAIKGSRNDGHKYIQSLYEAGVRNFVITEKIDSVTYSDATFLLVDNAIDALQKIAQHHRQQFDLLSIGITGSNGKTIVKEWLFQLLHQDYAIVRSPKSYNSQIGVPLSIWQIEPSHELGIFEAGISQLGEMKKLASIINCSIGIFTNIGTAHDEGFKSTTEKIKEKLRLFEYCKILIYNKDYPLIHQEIKALKNKKLLTCSTTQSADLQLIKIKSNAKSHSQLRAIYQHKEIDISIPFSGKANIENAMHCWLLLLHLGLKNEVIQERMLALEPVAMRLELKEGINDCTLINDSYNSDLHSLRIALNFADQNATHDYTTLIISDILQSGLSNEKLYKEVAAILKEKKINRVLGVGKEVNKLAEYLPEEMESRYFVSTKSLLSWLPEISFNKETILIKGARRFAFERIANRLTRKIHQTVLEVNLSALIHNLKVYSQFLKPETLILAMVKASAYGSGSFEVAKLLETQKVDYLGVAYADEGVELRQKGIKTPILVLNSELAVFDTMIEYDLEPEIYSIRQLNQFMDALSNVTSAYPIHINLETGMNRLGVESQELEALVNILTQNREKVYVKSIFSHLAASEESQQDDFTHQQVALFQQNYSKIVDKIGYKPLSHLLNSAGISRWPQYQMDMVRLGIGLYGIDASNSIQNQLQVVNSLKASISQIKTINNSETIGYNRKGSLPHTGKIATISIGYADGLLRLASNGNYKVGLHGQKAPIIGNICMDMCMIDISDIPSAKEGDEVEIFGNFLGVQELAHSLKTIPYEIFTNISDRVKRVYFQE